MCVDQALRMSHQHSDITIESDLSADLVRLHVTRVLVLAESDDGVLPSIDCCQQIIEVI